MDLKKQIEKQIKLKTKGLEDNRLDQVQLQDEISKTEKYLDSMINKLGKLRQNENDYIYRLEHLNNELWK